MSPTPTIQQTDGTLSEALKLLNSSASTLGFTAEDIQAFLLHRSADLQQPTESKPPTVYHPAVLDPSLSKTTENSLPRGDPNNPLGLSRNQRVKLSALTQDEAMDS